MVAPADLVQPVRYRRRDDDVAGDRDETATEPSYRCRPGVRAEDDSIGDDLTVARRRAPPVRRTRGPTRRCARRSGYPVRARRVAGRGRGDPGRPSPRRDRERRRGVCSNRLAAPPPLERAARTDWPRAPRRPRSSSPRRLPGALRRPSTASRHAGIWRRSPRTRNGRAAPRWPSRSPGRDAGPPRYRRRSRASRPSPTRRGPLPRSAPRRRCRRRRVRERRCRQRERGRECAAPSTDRPCRRRRWRSAPGRLRGAVARRSEGPRIPRRSRVRARAGRPCPNDIRRASVTPCRKRKSPARASARACATP